MDGTVGTGGHSEEIARRLGPEGRLICLDRDTDALRLSEERLRAFGERVKVLKGNFSEMKTILAGLDKSPVDGVLLDLGLSTLQLDFTGRGFSFNRDEPLDMRMDPEQPETAETLVNKLPAREIEEILRKFGEERKARRIAALVERRRKQARIRTSLQLAGIVESVIPRSRKPGAKHPATRTFQALRIAVNRGTRESEFLFE